MADPTLPSPPFPRDTNQTPYISSADSAGKHTVPASNWFYDVGSGLWLPVTSTRGLPIVPKKSDGTEILTDAAPGSVKLTGRKLKVGILKTSYTTQVNAGAQAVVQITPTAGYIGRLVSVGFYVDAVAGSTGNHSLAVQVGTFNGGTTIYSVVHVSGVGTSPLALSPSSQVDYGFKHAPFSAEQPLNVVYTAPLTNPQTAYRYLMVVWEEEAII
jgi:hypothetical protein